MTQQQKIVAKHFPGASSKGLRNLINRTVDSGGNVRGACSAVALNFSGKASLDSCIAELEHLFRDAATDSDPAAHSDERAL